MTSPPTLQTKKPCHSHLLMLPWVQTQVRDIALIFEPTFGSTLHPLLPLPFLSFTLLMQFIGKSSFLQGQPQQSSPSLGPQQPGLSGICSSSTCRLSEGWHLLMCRVSPGELKKVDGQCLQEKIC